MRIPAVRCAIAALGALAVLLASAPASAQTSVGGIALNQFEPAPAGDPFFGVPSPSIGGHLEPRAALVFDYSDKPLRLVLGSTETAVVASQAYLRFDASLSLFDRILVNVHVPFAVAQSGEDPMLTGVNFNPPSGAEFGDLRLGVRGRLLGDDASPFQISLGGYFFAPTGPSESYVGEGAVRGAPHVIFGGKVGTGTAFVWTASAGVMLRASENPHTFTFGGGAGVLLLDEALTLGAEAYGGLALGQATLLEGTGLNVTEATRTNFEVLGSARVRFLRGLTIGAAAGPGVAAGLGTPTFRFAALLGWMPPSSESSEAQSTKKEAGDRDNDGFRDDVDACPDEKGDLQGDPSKDGCPPPDRDFDSVLDVEDACPNEPGARSSDATKHGCPQDGDGDGISDTKDACPKVKGSPSEDARLNGCPQDGDGDGILDDTDACATQKGARSPDPAKNGCPLDTDGDQVADVDDACPRLRGVRSSDPKRNGCPGVAEPTAVASNLGIDTRIEFHLYGKGRTQTVEPVTDDQLRAIRDSIVKDPTIELVEVRGHTDDSGDPQFNAQLALERAEAVRGWLIAVGTPANKLVAKGYGDQAPVGDNRIFDGRQKNRRVEFKVIKRK
jgi:outer membrane protein OmpA-like peptidoglycan-associated protein